MGARDDILALFAPDLLDSLGPDSSAPDGRRSRPGFALRHDSAQVREGPDTADEVQWSCQSKSA